MPERIDLFCNMLVNRSIENQHSLNALYSKELWGNCFSILRQELDSLLRVMFLLGISDLEQRNKFITQTLNGEKWSFINDKGKKVYITDKTMVDLADSLIGWAKNVYMFGCGFIHLSNFHNYAVINPFVRLPQSEKDSIIYYMRSYHNAILDNNSPIEDFLPYLPKIMDKISGNLNCYIQELKRNERQNIL